MERYEIWLDGVHYTLERDEAFEAEVIKLAKHTTFKDLAKIPLPYEVIFADMERVHTTEPQVISCPRCGSEDTMKYGVAFGSQQYICKKCRSKFNTKEAPKGMRTPANLIGEALAMFYDGLSLAHISKHLQEHHNNYVNPSTVYRWVGRYSREAVAKLGAYKAETGRIWAADETVLSVAGAKTKEGAANTLWFWDVICEDTKFLLASHMSQTRAIRDAEAVFTQARQRAVSAPRFIVTDRLSAYMDGIERVFGAESRHIQSQGMRTETHNNIIERFHGTVKDRTKVMRGLKSPESAKLIMDGWLVHYNFFRPHMSLKGKTPAMAAGIDFPYKNWTDVVKGSGEVNGDG